MFLVLVYTSPTRERFSDLKLCKMRAIFCGNLEYDARQSEVERLFKKYGRVERVDMKSGEFCVGLNLC